jgi:hypothetical protein
MLKEYAQQYQETKQEQENNKKSYISFEKWFFGAWVLVIVYAAFLKFTGIR